MNKKYLNIVKNCEDHLSKYGDNYKGVVWPNEEDTYVRYRVMLDVIKDKNENKSILDFGCGCSHLLDFIKKNNISNIEYYGLDLSDKFIEVSRRKYPDISYYEIDILNEEFDVKFDYVVINGIFTQKVDLSFDEMLDFFKKMIVRIFNLCNEGIAFNVMSKQVDWERDDLFHLPLNILAEFLTKEISRHFVIRNDYGLYEYTVYLYKRPFRLIL